MTDKRETSDGERGVVTMCVEAFAVNRDGEGGAEGETLVCSFERTVLALRNEE